MIVFATEEGPFGAKMSCFIEQVYHLIYVCSRILSPISIGNTVRSRGGTKTLEGGWGEGRGEAQNVSLSLLHTVTVALSLFGQLL